MYKIVDNQCNCKDITPQTEECYAQMITVEVPPHMESYRIAREKEGLSSLISIDPCIYGEICKLWELSITTYGSCCGHNKSEAFVNVAEKDIKQMKKLGYIQNHLDKNRKDTFKLKLKQK